MKIGIINYLCMQITINTIMDSSKVLDFVCVIHGDLHDWIYVEKLSSMLDKHLRWPFRFNVFTETSRPVPHGMIKHDLIDWPGIQGKRSAWWYKMQIFDPSRNLGNVLYLDLDTVIVNDVTWIGFLDTNCFWSIKDFKYLWRQNWQGMNSSFMYFDTQKFGYIWNNFCQSSVQQISKQFRGDQDYLSATIQQPHLRYIDLKQALSWRWQVFQGGLDTKTRKYKQPNQPTQIPIETSMIIFHGTPKPHQIQDAVIQSYWS